MNLWRVAMDPEEGRVIGELEPLPTPSPFAAHPSVAADGSLIVYSNVVKTQNLELAALDPEADTLLAPFQLTTGTRQWSSPDPTPDGSLIAFYSLTCPRATSTWSAGTGPGFASSPATRPSTASPAGRPTGPASPTSRTGAARWKAGSSKRTGAGTDS